MSQRETKNAEFTDGRTKQAFRDETDINQILKRAQKTGTISHLAKHEGRYADFSGYDFFQNQLMLVRGREMFDDLPSEIRSEFDQSPAAFFEYVNDPENKDRLGELLPALAEPGRQNISSRGVLTADEARAAAENEIAPPIVPADKTERPPVVDAEPPTGASTDST